jgi:hypothetical protein
MIAFGGDTALGTSLFWHATIGPSTEPKTRKSTLQVSR